MDVDELVRNSLLHPKINSSICTVSTENENNVAYLL
jgi:hypothetical protein